MVQIDAPRHLYLHTETSLQRLADETGFQIEKVLYDATGFQFWGSEQYVQDIPLRSPNSHDENPQGSIFSATQLQEFTARAMELNQKADGEQAAFILRAK